MLKTTKILGLFSLTALLFAGCIKDIKPNLDASCEYQFDEAPFTGNGWSKVLDENFDQDLSKWNTWYGGAHNNEYQLYRPENVKLEGGILKLESKKQTITGPEFPGDPDTKSFGFTSGRIETKAFYGPDTDNPSVCMVARIQIPKGIGMWPAFWSCGTNWPMNGEIDILENDGKYTQQYTTNYFFGDSPGVSDVVMATSSVAVKPGYSLMNCFHVYQVIWTKDKLSFYLDGTLVDEKIGSEQVHPYIDDLFGKEHQVILNLAVGGNFVGNPAANTIQPGTMLVDWVKVYKRAK